MSLLKISHVPPATVDPGASVLEAVHVMERHGVGAVAVLENGQPRGIFTERDVMLRVVLKDLNAKNIKVRDVMTSPVQTASDEMTEEDALTHMLEKHIRHLPVVSKSGQLLGMLSIRNVLEYQVDILSRELHSLDQYLANDGPGG